MNGLEREEQLMRETVAYCLIHHLPIFNLFQQSFPFPPSYEVDRYKIRVMVMNANKHDKKA
jgi:hypothetical protein